MVSYGDGSLVRLTRSVAVLVRTAAVLLWPPVPLNTQLVASVTVVTVGVGRHPHVVHRM